MIIFPAIDIKDNNCVRLLQGDFEMVNIYGDDPSEMAKKWMDKLEKYAIYIVAFIFITDIYWYISAPAYDVIYAVLNWIIML